MRCWWSGVRGAMSGACRLLRAAAATSRGGGSDERREQSAVRGRCCVRCSVQSVLHTLRVRASHAAPPSSCSSPSRRSRLCTPPCLGCSCRRTALSASTARLRMYVWPAMCCWSALTWLLVEDVRLGAVRRRGDCGADSWQSIRRGSVHFTARRVQGRAHSRAGSVWCAPSSRACLPACPSLCLPASHHACVAVRCVSANR